MNRGTRERIQALSQEVQEVARMFRMRPDNARAGFKKARKSREPEKNNEPPTVQDSTSVTPLTHSDLDSVLRDPVLRVHALSDAAVVLATEAVASGVPHEEVERIVRSVRDPKKKRGERKRVLQAAREVFIAKSGKT